MIVKFSDISKRIRSIDNIKSSGSNYKPRLYTEQNIFCTNNAIYAIEHWQLLAENSNEAFNKALDIYDEICLNANISTIKTCCSCLVEGVNKVRDASQLFKSLKNRFGRIKRKTSTRINRKQSDINDAIQDAINSVKNTISAKGIATNQDNQQVQNTVEECYNLLIQEAKRIKECDRIINNYAKVSRRFNIDKLVSEVTSSDNLYLTVMEIARCMDTYDMEFKNKYSHALEISYYALNKNNMNFSNHKIIEAVTDYFIFSSVLTENNISVIDEVKKDSVLFTDDDFESIDYLMDNEDSLFESNIASASDIIEDYCSPYRNINEAIDFKGAKKQFKAKKKEVKKAARDLKQDARKGNPDERVGRSTQREINAFRKECLKDPDNKNNVTRLKAMINGIFTKNPDQIVYCLPNIFNIILAMVTILFTAINPIIGLMSFITNQIIKLTLSRKQTEKIVKAYQSEIDKAKEKLDKAKDDKAKDALQKYLDELNKDYSKIKEYENNLYSDNENYERDTSIEYNGEDDDFGLDDWDDFDFEEAASIVYISELMQSISEGLIDDNIEGIVFNNIYKLDNDAIDQLTDFSITVPTILERNKLCESLADYRNELRESSNCIEDYIRIDCINENIYKLKSNNMVYATSNNLSGIRCYLACLNEMVNLNISEQYVLEMNFTNTLKLAVDRLKKTAVKLKDKDKQVSNSIDVAVNNVSKGMETAMMNGNREAVIKGKIIPSASKCIKIACGLGAAWVVNPAIAVIAAIGGFACSAKLRSKERQLILDDLDIELKMCERYIKQAEDDNDLKKVRQLEMIQRNLLRQQQRLKYKMHVDFKQDDPLDKIGDNDD